MSQSDAPTIKFRAKEKPRGKRGLRQSSTVGPEARQVVAQSSLTWLVATVLASRFCSRLDDGECPHKCHHPAQQSPPANYIEHEDCDLLVVASEARNNAGEKVQPEQDYHYFIAHVSLP